MKEERMVLLANSSCSVDCICLAIAAVFELCVVSRCSWHIVTTAVETKSRVFCNKLQKPVSPRLITTHTDLIY